MDNQSNEDRGNWTIKAVPASVRAKAARHAKMNGESVAAWLARAVNQLASLEESGPRIIPPGEAQPGPTRADPPGPTPVGPAVDAVGLALLVAEAREAAAAAGVPLSKTLARQVQRLTLEQARAARGLPPPARRQGRPGPTLPRIGPTIDGEPA